MFASIPQTCVRMTISYRRGDFDYTPETAAPPRRRCTPHDARNSNSALLSSVGLNRYHGWCRLSIGAARRGRLPDC
jgi:hypothetical protein